MNDHNMCVLFHCAGGQGYFVRSTRTVTRLAKMVRNTRPEGILISDHLSAPHVLSFLGRYTCGRGARARVCVCVCVCVCERERERENMARG